MSNTWLSTRCPADLLPASFASINWNTSSSVMSWFLSLNCMSLSATPHVTTSRRIFSVYLTSCSQFKHLVVNLHIPAWPRRRVPKLHIVSSRSWCILCNRTLATMEYSTLTTNFFIAAMTSSTGLLVSVPPAFLIRSLRSGSLQHSSSCITLSLPACEWLWALAE